MNRQGVSTLGAASSPETKVNEDIATGLAEPTVQKWALWMQDLQRSLAARAQFALYGNIRSNHLIPVDGRLASTSTIDCLWHLLAVRGYEFLLVYDKVDRLRVYPENRRELASQLLSRSHDDAQERLELKAGVPVKELPRYIRAITHTKGQRAAFIVDYASRLTDEDPDEKEFFIECEKLSHTAHQLAGKGGKPLYNPVIWLLNQENDLPDWFLVGNESIRMLSVPMPDFDTRREAAEIFAPSLAGFDSCDSKEQEALLDIFANSTEGMSLSSMDAITQLAKDGNIAFRDIADAVRCYKVGIPDNPWKKGHIRKRVQEAEANIRERVKGQRQAITKTLDILKRSVMGLTGAHASAQSGRPRGVLFFAGPTGVGKTELAKAITKEILGNEQAYVRFDMSEFSSEHAQDRLIGAPPGYVGYDAGGELTNAIRQRPFSVVLFDEIEKAHYSLLDKFLQILEDGRLTDGRGNTVYFSEAIIIFTSNLGIYVEEQVGEQMVRRPNISLDSPPPYDEVAAKVRSAIDDHFKLKLNRPELLNRIGDNIVVFDCIRPKVATQIFDKSLKNVTDRVESEHRLSLEIPPGVRKVLLDLCTQDLSDGGRGIGNQLETAFVNPLARALFARSLQPDFGKLSALAVEEITSDENSYSVVLR